MPELGAGDPCHASSKIVIRVTALDLAKLHVAVCFADNRVVLLPSTHMYDILADIVHQAHLAVLCIQLGAKVRCYCKKQAQEC